MIVGKFLDHAVVGYRGKYPRSKNEAALGTSIGALIAVLYRENSTLFWLGTASAVAWAGFYLWAMVVAIRQESRKGDLEFDRRGKFRLAKEYWTTGSATSAKARRKKNG